MPTNQASDLGRALAVMRRRDTFLCEICGEPYEAWARKTQQARTCSPKCRARLHRQEHKKDQAPMPKLSKWRAQHKGCQKAVDDLKAHYDALLQKRVSFACSNCGDDFTEPLSAFALQPNDETLAPALCVACGHSAEDADPELDELIQAPRDPFRG